MLFGAKSIISANQPSLDIYVNVTVLKETLKRQKPKKKERKKRNSYCRRKTLPKRSDLPQPIRFPNMFAKVSKRLNSNYKYIYRSYNLNTYNSIFDQCVKLPLIDKRSCNYMTWDSGGCTLPLYVKFTFTRTLKNI